MVPARLQPYLFGLIAVATLACFAAYDLQRERSRSVTEARSNTANLARLIDHQTVQLLGRVDAVLNDVETRMAADHGNSGAASASDTPGHVPPSLLPVDGLIRSIHLLDPEGRLLPSGVDGGPAAAFDADFLADWRPRARASEANRLWIGRPWRDSNGAWVIPVGRPLAGADAPSLRGHLVALVRLAVLQPLLDGVYTGRNGFVTLFLRDGWMLATSPRNDALFSRNWVQTPMFQQHLVSAPAGTVQQVVVRDSTERIYSYRTLETVPLVVSAGISMTDALADWRARIVTDVLLLSIVAGAALWGAMVLSRNYARRESAERAAAQATVRIEQSERFVREVTDNLPMRIAYLDKDLRYRFVNKALCDQFGLQREAILGRTPQELTEQPLPAEVQDRVQAALDGVAQRFEMALTWRGAAQVLESFLVPQVGPDGQVQGFYAASTDVTDRHQQQRRIERALAERETLLREVYHRVKNNLQVIQSLLNIQRRTLPEGPTLAALDDSVKRVHAMALVHEKLYQTGHLDAVSLPEYMTELLRYLGDMAGAARRGISLQSDIGPIEASLEVSVPLGLLITELVGNSLKHAFPDGRGGSIRVTVSRRGESVVLEVADDGVGLPPGFDPARATSMGLQLASSLAAQLGGELQVANVNGARFSVHARLPL